MTFEDLNPRVQLESGWPSADCWRPSPAATDSLGRFPNLDTTEDLSSCKLFTVDEASLNSVSNSGGGVRSNAAQWVNQATTTFQASGGPHLGLSAHEQDVASSHDYHGMLGVEADGIQTVPYVSVDHAGESGCWEQSNMQEQLRSLDVGMQACQVKSQEDATGGAASRISSTTTLRSIILKVKPRVRR